MRERFILILSRYLYERSKRFQDFFHDLLNFLALYCAMYICLSVV